MRVTVAALVLAAALIPGQARAVTKPLTTADLLGSFANVDATKTYLPGSNGTLAQAISDKMFAALSGQLGGESPTVGFVNQVDQPGAHAQAHLGTNRYDLDPLALTALVNAPDPAHSGIVNAIPHEMAHLRQIPAALADTTLREGGAQAFADLEALRAARAAHVSYDPTRNYDGAYADYVKQVMAQRGLAWALAGQFGR